ncbi:MAG: DUF4340 domain-containing protein [Candidatus Latescibacterota bacterium]
MKLKKEFIVLAVIVAALLLYILFKNSDKTHYTLPALAKIAKNDISKLVIERSGGTLIVEGQGSEWKIQPQGYPADQTAVDRMLDAMEGFELGTLVSESENYHQFDLTEDKKIALQVFGGEQSLRKLDVGKTASTYQHTFVRIDGDHRVYQAGGNIRQPFDVDMEKLRDKVVAQVERDFVTALTIKSVDDSLTVEKYEAPPIPQPGAEEDSVAALPRPVWSAIDGRAGDENVINGIIGALASLRCVGFIEGKSKEDFADPLCTITLHGTAAVTVQIFAKQPDNKYPAVSSQSDYPFFLTEGVVNRLKKAPNELLAKTDAGK